MVEEKESEIAHAQTLPLKMGDRNVQVQVKRKKPAMSGLVLVGVFIDLVFWETANLPLP